LKLTVLDYGAGNLKSIANMLDSLSLPYEITDNKENIKNSERLIFPGVGNFGQVMASLNSKDLTESLISTVKSGVPFLGICLGLQVLFEESEEAPNVKGLGIFKGKVIKFTQGKVPQIGWNQLIPTENNSILTPDYVYFVNSFYADPQDKSIISAYSNYYIDYTAAVEHENITAFQFHPEKSGKIGYDFISKWITR